MPLVGGGLLQPYADVQYIDKTDRFRIERRKIRPPVKVRYGVIKPRVYYTSVEQTDHAELEIVDEAAALIIYLLSDKSPKNVLTLILLFIYPFLYRMEHCCKPMIHFEDN